jgi:type IV fimbrial biogenesis protein FimT
VLNQNQGQQGFSLIELMVTIAILSLLMMAAVPSFGNWVANARVRSVAEEVANGLRMAQSEAVRRNRPVAFVMTNSAPAKGAAPAANGKNWYVQALPLSSSGDAVDPSDYVQGGNYASQSGVTISSTNSVLCFASMGNVSGSVATAKTALGVDCSAAGANTYVVARTGADRSLKVTVGVGGQVRMCDPAKTLSTTQPDGC